MTLPVQRLSASAHAPYLAHLLALPDAGVMARPASATNRPVACWRACVGIAMAAWGTASGWAQTVPGVPLAWPATTSARPPGFAARSVLFDAQGAQAARDAQQPVYVESIIVEGRDPDARQRRARPLEQRFAEALLAPASSSRTGLRGLDTTPCMSLQSTWNTIGNSYAPLTGCP